MVETLFDPDSEIMTPKPCFPRKKMRVTHRHLSECIYCSDFAGSWKSIHGPNPKVVMEICIMALKCCDTSAPVEIICKEADVRPIKMSRTDAFLTPQLPDSFLESRLFWFLL